MKGRVDSKVLIVGLIVLGVIVVVFGIMSSVQPTSQNTISAYGDGSVEALPDYVVVYFNVQTSGDSASEVTDENAVIVDTLKANLVLLGFSESEIKTSNFNVYPTYDYEGGIRKDTGYETSHSVNLKLDIDDSGRVGEVIDAGVGAGAGINYISFELTKDNQNMYKTEAIEKATEDARRKAEALASGADKKLGNIVSLSSDSGYFGGPWIAYSASDSGSAERSGAEIATDINPGEQEVSARVTGVWSIR